MKLSQKAAHVRALVDGLKFEENSEEGKVLKAVSELLEDIAAQVEELAVAFNEAVDTIDDINCDLSDLEDAVYGKDDEDGESIYECICPSCGEAIDFDSEMLAEGGVTCPNCGSELEFEADFDEEEPEYETVCPNCEDTIVLDEAMLAKGEVTCPGCGEVLEFDFCEEDTEEDGQE